MGEPADANLETGQPMADRPREFAHVERVATHQDEVAIDAVGGHLDEMPKGYYYSAKFLGTFAASNTALISGYSSYNLPAGILSTINQDLGATSDINWVSIVWTVGFGIGLALVGRLSDIFGRRWFFISATVLALIGNIVACRCQSVNELIGANAIIGLAAAGQLSYNIVIGELVPNRDRGPFNGLVLILSFPFNVFAPIVARLFILHTEQSWRWGYYIGIILNGVGCILWYAFYHPPTYDMLHIHGRTKLNQLRHLDWMGILLFVGGLAFFLIGVSRGGVTYPWRSVQVLTPFLIGFATLVGFCLWEGYAKLQSPLMPMRLFTNLEYVTLVICASIGVMVFYSMLVLWPVLVGVLFETELINIGYVSCTLPAGFTVGQILGGLGLKYLPKMKYQMIISTVITVTFIGAVASVTPEAKARTMIFIVLGGMGAGYVESLCFTSVGLVWEPAALGLVCGVMGAIRTAAGSVAIAMYVSILATQLTKYIPRYVAPTVTAAGLPESSLPALFAGLSTGNFTAVPGITPLVIEAAVLANKHAYAKSFSIVFLCTIPWGAVMLIAAIFTPNMEPYLTDEVPRKLHDGYHRKLEEEKVVPIADGSGRKPEERVNGGVTEVAE